MTALMSHIMAGIILGVIVATPVVMAATVAIVEA